MATRHEVIAEPYDHYRAQGAHQLMKTDLHGEFLKIVPPPSWTPLRIRVEWRQLNGAWAKPPSKDRCSWEQVVGVVAWICMDVTATAELTDFKGQEHDC